MSLDIYFSEDISRRLDALEQTAQYMEPGDFQAGFVAALQAVRAAFGLPQTAPYPFRFCPSAKVGGQS